MRGLAAAPVAVVGLVRDAGPPLAAVVVLSFPAQVGVTRIAEPLLLPSAHPSTPPPQTAPVLTPSP